MNRNVKPHGAGKLGRRGRIAATAGLAAALSIALVGEALAAQHQRGPGKQIVRTSAAVLGSADFATARTTVRCPRRYRAVGGGFYADPPQAGTHSLPQIWESRRIGQRAWRVSAGQAQSSAVTTSTIIAYVYCRLRLGRIVQRSGVAQIGGPEAAGAAVARCPRRHKAAFGGFWLPPWSPAAGLSAIASMRQGARAWRTAAYTFYGAGSFRTWVYCVRIQPRFLRNLLRRLGRLPVRHRLGRLGTEPYTPAVTVPSPRCPRRGKQATRPMAGGFATFGGPGASVPFVFRSFRRGGNWLTSAFRNGMATPGTTPVRSLVYCA